MDFSDFYTSGEDAVGEKYCSADFCEIKAETKPTNIEVLEENDIIK